MTEADTVAKGKIAARPRADAPATETVLQVERHDYVDLAPTNRPRSQSLRGFDECYTDIVDYIVRCTHKIWDERDVGLIYTHYTHNAVLYGTMGTLYSREEVVHDTIQRLVSLPERRGMATQVIWRGNDEDGFYTSHLVTGSGRHTQFGHYGEPTGRTFVSRTIADCMVYENKIYREWVVADTMAIIKQLGLDPHAFADRVARTQFDKGFVNLDIGENRRLLGQYPPETEADVSLAHDPLEDETLRWLHEVYNKRMFGKIKEVYAPDRAVARTADEGTLRPGRRAAPDPGARRLDPGLLVRGPAHLLGGMRGGRHEGRGALGHRGPPPRLRAARRADRPAPAGDGHVALPLQERPDRRRLDACTIELSLLTQIKLGQLVKASS